MTPQEPKMVCKESNEINGEKIVLCSTAGRRKKIDHEEKQ